jgi:lysophospholipase L1-like esterase
MPFASSADEFYELNREESFNKKILVEGDSWVSHPLVPNLSRQIEGLGRNNFNVLSLGSPGDTVLGVLNRHAGQYKLLEQLLSDQQFGVKFDMIFLSAAGNDIIGPEIRYYIDHINDHPQGTPLEQLINPGFHVVVKQIARDYKMFLNMRDASGLNANTPVITHSYSYLQPRPKGTHAFGHQFNDGWISIYLNDKGITDPDDQLVITNKMLELFRDSLNSVIADNFLVADTLKVLSTGGKPDTSLFFDEIHPNRKGFDKVGKFIQRKAKAAGFWPA